MNTNEAAHLVDVHLDAAALIQARCDHDTAAFWSVLGTSDGLAIEIILAATAIAATLVEEFPDPPAALALLRERIISLDADTP